MRLGANEIVVGAVYLMVNIQMSASLVTRV